MTRKLALLASSSVLALGLSGCFLEGSRGPVGPAGAPGLDAPGPVMPEPDQTLGQYDPAGDPDDQEIDEQIPNNRSTGVWAINLDHQVQLDLGLEEPAVADAIVYDSDHRILWVTVDGIDYPLSLGNNQFDDQESHGCNDGVEEPCIDHYGKREGDYAILSRIRIDFGPETESVGYAVFGVKTAAEDMPAGGTGYYEGEGHLTYQIKPAGDVEYSDYQSGDVNIVVDFGASEDQVNFSQTNGSGSDTHQLTGLATIDGNSYEGEIAGTIIGYDDNLAHTLHVSGTMEGSFYGPKATEFGDARRDSETAGTWEASDDELPGATGSAVGGFVTQFDGWVEDCNGDC